MEIKKEKISNKNIVLPNSEHGREDFSSQNSSEKENIDREIHESSDKKIIINLNHKVEKRSIEDIESEKNSDFLRIIHKIVFGKRIIVDKSALQLIVKRNAISEISGALILESEYSQIKDKVDPDKKLNIHVIKNSPQEKIIADDMAKRLFLGQWQTLSIIVAKRENCSLYLSTRIKEDFYLSRIRAVSIDLLV